MGMRCALTTAHHPQADGQTENLNQTLEIALRAYIGPSRSDWDTYLDGLCLSYNTTPHVSTRFAPAHLLYGFTPVTATNLLAPQSSIPRPLTGGSDKHVMDTVCHEEAQNMVENFNTNCTCAKESLYLAQEHQRRAYNKGRLMTEFNEGDLVVFNPHSLELLREEKGRGKKLLMKYDGPFEIIRKLSPVTYQLRLPASYGMHPILNIAHLEPYDKSPAIFTPPIIMLQPC